MTSSHLSATASLLCTCLLSALLTGCALETTAAPSPVPGSAISGVAFGGQQPITGARVYLLAANPAGYGNASLSLLTSASTGAADGNVGAYVTTAPVTGGFNLAGDYSCTTGFALGADTSAGSTSTTLPGSEQVYLYVLGGNSGSGTNNRIGLLAALGPCNAIYSNKITVNEITTVAAAYAFAGYATDATHVSSSGTALALTGLANAGLNSANLVNLATGLPVPSDAATTRPVAALYTLADILAACVNGTTSNKSCITLFQYTESAGTTGASPVNTATAAMNLAHNPVPTSAGVTALYGLVPATGAPYSGALSTQPTDFTLSLNYTGGGLNKPQAIAIDGSGNAWTANHGNNSVSKFSSTGVAISPSTGFTGGGLNKPTAIAIDGPGTAWVTNFTVSSSSPLSRLSSTGMPISPSTGYSGGGLVYPQAVAVDTNGNIWAANYFSSLSELSSAGAPISPSSNPGGYGADGNPDDEGGLNQPYAIAFDVSPTNFTTNLWIANIGNDTLSKFALNGTAISPAAGYTGGGLNQPTGIAVDAAGNVWAANFGNDSVSEFSNSGLAISPSTGYTGGLNAPYGLAIDAANNVWVANSGGNSISRLSSTGAILSPLGGYTTPGAGDYGIAIDGSGDVWTSNITDNSLTEMIGAATPVHTPLFGSLAAPISSTVAKP